MSRIARVLVEQFIRNLPHVGKFGQDLTLKGHQRTFCASSFRNYLQQPFNNPISISRKLSDILSKRDRCELYVTLATVYHPG